uniref:Light-harvesting complex-like protein OHP2, chloroplastic n=1 Tax=Leersia perrieri TaxID=77586 RepID=A0A0D9V2F8_9ORYZ
MTSAHGLTGTVGWRRMSERAAPMSSPCKPHKPQANSLSNTPLKLGDLGASVGRGSRAVGDLAGWHWHHTLLSTAGVRACVQTFSTHSSLHFHSLSPSPSKNQETVHLLALLQRGGGDEAIVAMSLAPSIPYIKVKVGGVAVTPPPHRVCRSSFAVIRSSKADGPRRPAAPPLSPPPPMPPKSPALSTPPTLSQPPTPVKPAAPSSSPSQDPEPKPAAAPVAVAAPPAVAGSVTLEYQRKVAKDLQDYFKQKKLEEADQGPFFGFVGKNEISNGRWAMFGFAVGMLTEYATGSDFVQQVKILLSNFGIVDLD